MTGHQPRPIPVAQATGYVVKCASARFALSVPCLAFSQRLKTKYGKLS